MLIGIDFDNTIICYGDLFYRVAHELSYIYEISDTTKNGVRRALLNLDKEDKWTEVQGIVYGSRMMEAKPFLGVIEFIQKAQSLGHEVYIVSHKTQHPVIGDKIDLHGVAREWLRANAFFSVEGAALKEDNVFFELSQEEKARRIKILGCNYFIDDLLEFLVKDCFPRVTRKVLFDAERTQPSSPGMFHVHSWAEIERIVLG